MSESQGYSSAWHESPNPPFERTIHPQLTSIASVILQDILPLAGVREQFGTIDIYLFDQLARGRIKQGMRILDAGCGSGRNLGYLLRAGFDVSAVDETTAAVESVYGLARRFAPTLSPNAFRVEPIEKLSFDDASFDFIISSAVLHFARGEEHFRGMLDAMWRTLRRDGLLFVRLASTIGMPMESFTPVGDRRFHLPDGSERFLVDEDMLTAETDRLGAQLGDPIKTTVVQNVRCMTTWVLRKV